jgi:hypothetical protein
MRQIGRSVFPGADCETYAVSTEGAGADAWIVWRQDDHGNRAEVARFAVQEEAEELARTMEARGHKQLYWATPG